MALNMGFDLDTVMLNAQKAVVKAVTWATAHGLTFSPEKNIGGNIYTEN